MPHSPTVYAITMKLLQESQLTALSHVRASAGRKKQSALEKTTYICEQAAVPMQQYSQALSAIQANAPIDVSFHPDRMGASGDTVVADLLAAGNYKSQFETGISNGGLSAYKGGNRDLWEQRLFGGAYQEAGVCVSHRPKYGALNLMNYWDGACPRFGSCYFRLKPAVASRCSFSYGDSSTNPDDIVVMDEFDAVLTALICDVADKHSALGANGLNVESFFEYLARTEFSSRAWNSPQPPGRCLDECIEVHIHGAIELAIDVEWLAVDSSFYPTQCGEQLVELSKRYQFPIHWNPAFELSTRRVPDDFRGPLMVPLAHRIAPDGLLNAAKIGCAAMALHENSDDWLEWGTTDETRQYLKQIWHVLVAYGRT